MSDNTFTPGPWQWEMNFQSKQLKLCGGNSRYDLTVMDFTRWGMNGACPRFLEPKQNHSMNIMHH